MASVWSQAHGSPFTFAFMSIMWTLGPCPTSGLAGRATSLNIPAALQQVRVPTLFPDVCPRFLVYKIS